MPSLTQNNNIETFIIFSAFCVCACSYHPGCAGAVVEVGLAFINSAVVEVCFVVIAVKAYSVVAVEVQRA